MQESRSQLTDCFSPKPEGACVDVREWGRVKTSRFPPYTRGDQIANMAYLPDSVSRLHCDRLGRAVGARSGTFDLLMLFRLLVGTVENPPNV